MAANIGDQRLKGKVAIVTGAASGFGRAIASRFLAAGCRVVAADVNEAGAQQTVKDSGLQHGTALKMDVTSQSDWASAVQAAESQFGRLDIIVNNVGTSKLTRNSLIPSKSDSHG